MVRWWLAATLFVAGAAAFLAWPRPPRWPDLPSDHFISGRAATIEDVRAGNAAFAVERRGEFIGVPASMEIPQYAWYWSREEKTWYRAVIIQAERAPDGQLWFGLRRTSNSIGGIPALEEHVELLGRVVDPHRAVEPKHAIGDLPFTPSAAMIGVDMVLGREQQLPPRSWYARFDRFLRKEPQQR